MVCASWFEKPTRGMRVLSRQCRCRPGVRRTAASCRMRSSIAWRLTSEPNGGGTAWSSAPAVRSPTWRTSTRLRLGLGRWGIGRALHTACLGALRGQGYDEARLWVLEANPQARAFYQQLDWRWDGTTELHGFGDVELPIVRYCRALT